MTKVLTNDLRRNKEFHYDCFGHYFITKRYAKRISDKRCMALNQMKCRGCRFYKPLEQLIAEYDKYGYPEDYTK